MTKKFKFSVKTKSGKILHESIVLFGGENHPFPENWKEDYLVQRGIQDVKQQIFKENFSIEVSEDLTFTIEENQTEKDKLRFAIEQLNKLDSILQAKYEILSNMQQEYLGKMKEGQLASKKSGLRLAKEEIRRDLKELEQKLKELYS